MHDVPPFPLAVRTLVELLGCRLTAYIAGVRDVRVVDLWLAGIPDPGVEVRLRLAHAVAGMLVPAQPPDTIRGWFLDPQPRLGNRSPALAIREGDDPHEVFAVAPLTGMTPQRE